MAQWLVLLPSHVIVGGLLVCEKVGTLTEAVHTFGRFVNVSRECTLRVKFLSSCMFSTS